jgi:hypothetical protein
MSDKLNDFPEYASRVLLRLEEGARTYGDKSFEHSSSRLVNEIEQELLDVLGWGYVLWTRMRKLRGELVSLEEVRKELELKNDMLNEMELELGEARAELGRARRGE